MHEYSIVQSLVQRINAEVRRADATAVHGIVVSIGELSGVEPELLATAYETFRVGTICEHATLEIRRVPATYRCFACDREIARAAVLRCPWCSRPARLEAGDEITLERIELEVA